MRVVVAILLVITMLLVLVYAGIVTQCPPENGEDVTLIPNPKNCSTYFACNGGIPILMTCPGDLKYNPVLRVCDIPENVKCAKY